MFAALAVLVVSDEALAQRVEESRPMQLFEEARPLVAVGERMLDRGDEAEGKERLRRAKAKLDEALRREPGFVKAAELLGRVLLRLDDHEAAVTVLTKTLEVEPSASRVRYLLGVHLFRLGKGDEGARALERVVGDGDAGFDVHYLLMGHYYRRRKNTKALGHADAYLKSRPKDAAVHGLVGNIHLREGRTLAAIAAFRRVLEIDPDNVPVRVNLGTVFHKQGDHAEAAAIFESVLERRPGLALVHFNLGSSYLSLTRWEDAAKAFEAFIVLEPKHAGAHFFAGLARSRLNQERRALAHLLDAARLDPKDARPHYLIARLALRKSDYDAAYRHALAATKIAPKDGRFARLAGYVARRRNDTAAAIQHLERGTDLLPRDVAMRAELGRARLAAGDTDGGIDDLEAARALDRGSAKPSRRVLAWLPAARVQRGVDRVRRGDLKAAEADFSRALEIDPAARQASWNLALLLDLTDRATDALRVARAALQASPADPDLHLLAAWLLVRADEIERAQHAVQRAAGATEVGLRWLVQGAIHGHFGEFDAAVDAFVRAKELGADPGPALTSARLDRAADLLRKGRVEAALGGLERIDARLVPELERVRAGLTIAGLLARRGNDAAIGPLLDRLTSGPTPKGWGLESLARDRRLLRGYVDYRQGRERQAVERLEAHAKAHPDDARAKRLAAVVLSELAEREYAARRWHEAELLVERALAHWDDPRLVHNLACVRYSKGDHDRAAKAFERLNDDGAVAEAALNLGLYLDDVKGAVGRPVALYRKYLRQGSLATEIARRRIARKERIFGAK